MNIIEIYKQYPDQEVCIAHLEKIRWKGMPLCTYCDSPRVYKHAEKNKIRWQCGECRKSFSVTAGTIFHNTHIELQKWFLLISLMLNAKKGLSAYQAARDIDVRRATVWSMMHRIRKAMKDQEGFLHGVVEMDETYIGGKARKFNKRHHDGDDKGNRPKTGRGTNKPAVVGAVERKGRVKARSVRKYELRALGLQNLVRQYINPTNSMLITDEYPGYNSMRDILPHKSVAHRQMYVDGMIHTNTIESFWALLKRGILGQFHKVSNQYLDRYVDEFCYRYNKRNCTQEIVFNDMLGRIATNLT